MMAYLTEQVAGHLVLGTEGLCPCIYRASMSCKSRWHLCVFHSVCKCTFLKVTKLGRWMVLARDGRNSISIAADVCKRRKFSWTCVFKEQRSSKVDPPPNPSLFSSLITMFCIFITASFLIGQTLLGNKNLFALDTGNILSSLLCCEWVYSVVALRSFRYAFVSVLFICIKLNYTAVP